MICRHNQSGNGNTLATPIAADVDVSVLVQ